MLVSTFLELEMQFHIPEDVALSLPSGTYVPSHMPHIKNSKNTKRLLTKEIQGLQFDKMEMLIDE